MVATSISYSKYPYVSAASLLDEKLKTISKTFVSVNPAVLAPCLIIISSRDILIHVCNSVFHYHAADDYDWLGFKGKGAGKDDDDTVLEKGRSKGKGNDGDDAHDHGKGSGKGDDDDDDDAHDHGKGKGNEPSEEPAPETCLPKRPPPQRP